jgi:hypothetical protein
LHKFIGRLAVWPHRARYKRQDRFLFFFFSFFLSITFFFIYEFSYESTITAQFFGHTHYDEFQIFYDTSDLGRALSIAYVGPSVSPYYDLNPGYRIYYVDGDHAKTTRVSKHDDGR